MPTGLHISRRRLLKGAAIAIGLPPLEAMFDRKGIAYAATSAGRAGAPVAPETRFVLWFNGNGVGEKHWIPTESGPGYQLTPCLSPPAPFRGLGETQAQHFGCGPRGRNQPEIGAGEAGPGACRGSSGVYSRRGARDFHVASGIREGGRARDRRRYERLAAHRQATD